MTLLRSPPIPQPFTSAPPLPTVDANYVCVHVRMAGPRIQKKQRRYILLIDWLI